MAGRIHQINVSGGGVPKLPVPQVQITRHGVEGDTQADRVHHGGPDRAVCLYSLEVIEALQAEGHLIQAGYVGENLTIARVAWDMVVPGRRLQAGGALLEVTSPVTPCAKNARWFRDGDFLRMHAGRHPGWARMYARVEEEGTVTTGDPVELLD
jgi:MOSC domain-containing protein YiiM